jgi:uncharacterized protein
MAVVIGLTIFSLLTAMNVLLGAWLHEIATIPRTLLTTTATVSVMTWGIMPGLTRLLRGWLYPRG